MLPQHVALSILKHQTYLGVSLVDIHQRYLNTLKDIGQTSVCSTSKFVLEMDTTRISRGKFQDPNMGWYVSTIIIHISGHVNYGALPLHWSYIGLLYERYLQSIGS